VDLRGDRQLSQAKRDSPRNESKKKEQT